MTRFRMPPPGHTFALGDDNQLYSVPITADAAMMRTHGMRGGMGDLLPQSHPADGPGADKLRNDPEIRARFTLVPMFYPATCDLGPESGNTAAAQVTLRPEMFIIERITWATTGDAPPAVVDPTPTGGSVQARSVLVSWSDEFTKFVGNDTPTLVAALFGDSQGFLDLPRGLLIQGKQTLSVNLRRLDWPSDEDPITTRWDFIFHGVGLLPKGINQSGSAG